MKITNKTNKEIYIIESYYRNELYEYTIYSDYQKAKEALEIKKISCNKDFKYHKDFKYQLKRG